MICPGYGGETEGLSPPHEAIHGGWFHWDCRTDS